jgi:hypothetical protein
VQLVRLVEQHDQAGCGFQAGVGGEEAARVVGARASWSALF